MTSSIHSRHEIFNENFSFFSFALEILNSVQRKTFSCFHFFSSSAVCAAVCCLLLMFSRSVFSASVAPPCRFALSNSDSTHSLTPRLINKNEKKREKVVQAIAHFFFSKGKKKFCVFYTDLILFWKVIFICCNGERFTELLSPLYVI